MHFADFSDVMVDVCLGKIYYIDVSDVSDVRDVNVHPAISNSSKLNKN